VGSRLSTLGPQEKRFAAYMEGLAQAAGHADRHAPLKNYCKGLLLPGERKSVLCLILSINIDTHNTGCRTRVVGRRAPSVLQQPHFAELPQYNAAPVGRRTGGLQSALTFPAVLITQHPQQLLFPALP
jgi:hypothetical protein